MRTQGPTTTLVKGILLLSIFFSCWKNGNAQPQFAAVSNNVSNILPKKSAVLLMDYLMTGTVTKLTTREAASDKPNDRIATTSVKKSRVMATNRSSNIVRDEPSAIVTAENNLEETGVLFRPTTFTYPANSKADIGITQYSIDQLMLYAKVLKQYAKVNGFDTNYAFLSNMGMRSNRKRFFVINLKSMTIEQSGLVAHGRGQGPSVFDRQYSDIYGSKCTSLGKYRIAKKYSGGYGEAYKMIGLDSTNRNAYTRNIVLHSMGCIPDTDGNMPACVSEGCPAVSTRFLSSLQSIIDKSKKPVLLWIFDSNLEQAIRREDVSEPQPHTCAIHRSGAVIAQDLLP